MFLKIKLVTINKQFIATSYNTNEISLKKHHIKHPKIEIEIVGKKGKMNKYY